MNWENFRRPDGTIDLLKAWKSLEIELEQDELNNVIGFLEGVEAKRPIVSRQAAAIAVESASFFACIEI